MTERTCTIDGCTKKYRAKGYCGSHYNQILLPDRHVTKIVCAECSKTYTTTRTNGQYCSLDCYSANTKRSTAAKRAAQDAARESVAACRRIARAERDAARFKPDRRECAWCGSPYLAIMPNGAYCSHSCIRKASKVRRRAREANASGTYTWCEVTKIFLSLDRQCAYCHEQVDTFEPDHVIPLSRGGSNSITNIAPACHACNCDKRDLFLSEWYVDRERRGLSSVRLDQRVIHLTHALLAA